MSVVSIKKQDDNKTYLIYEKNVNGKGYNNPLSIKITPETLFSSDYQYFENKEAMLLYNEDNLSCKLPSLLDYGELYCLYYFVYDVNGLVHKVMLVAVDNILLNEYYEKNKKIPEDAFLIVLCRYDQMYRNGGVSIMDESTKKMLIHNNKLKIINNSLVANADATDPIECQPEYVSLQLFEYQKKTIRWMLTKEKEKNIVYIDNNNTIFGNIIYDERENMFYKHHDRKDSIQFNGGAIIDEVGLGKTFQIITASLINSFNAMEYIQPVNQNLLYSKATLIICPSQLSIQWINEIAKVIKPEFKIKVIPFFTKVHFDKYTYKDLLEADFIVTSFNYINSKCFLDQFVPKISKHNSYMSSSEYSYSKICEKLTEMKNQIKINMDNILSEKKACILMFYWHRIVIDEFHEIYSVSKYSSIINIIKHFEGNYKWCVTGTPFNTKQDQIDIQKLTKARKKNVDDSVNMCLFGMFDFVTNYARVNNSSIVENDIWMDYQLNKYMMTSFFRRNTRQSIDNENRLIPLKESIIWLDLTQTERLIYNAYESDKNIGEFDTVLRQICCHPKIVSELKNVISCCKTLDEIEKIMVEHYKSIMINAHNLVRICKYKLECLHRRLEIAAWKQYIRALRKLGYYVKIELEITKELECKKEMDELLQSLKKIDDINNLSTSPEYNDFPNVETESEDNAIKSKKKIIIVTNNNKDNVIDMVKNEIEEKSMEQQNLEIAIQNIKSKYENYMTLYIGKKSTYDYYINVMNKLKKITDAINSDSSDDEEDTMKQDKETCGICLSYVIGKNLGIIACGHIFCYQCIQSYISAGDKTDIKCPICRKKIKVTDIFMVIKNKESDETTHEFNNKQQLIQHVGTKLANLIFFLKKNDKHTIIFSQWNDLLYKVGDVLTDYGINNVFCRGNVWQRNKAIQEFNMGNKFKVIMLSSESMVSGTNLTKAEMVILLDPVYGSYEYRHNTEWQAIGRAYRTGQIKQVQVVRFIVKDTVEETIYNCNKKNDVKEKNDS